MGFVEKGKREEEATLRAKVAQACDKRLQTLGPEINQWLNSPAIQATMLDRFKRYLGLATRLRGPFRKYEIEARRAGCENYMRRMGMQNAGGECLP